MNELYTNNLAKEWIDWVENSNTKGAREKEIFPFIKKWVKKVNAHILLDLGCGQGDCSRFINSNVSYIGLDSSTILINRAKELYSSKNKKFILGNIYNIPLKNNSVNSIISIWVWSHLKDLKLAAREMYNVLKPQGHFLIITASPDTYKERKSWYKKYFINGNLLTGTMDLGNNLYLSDTTLYLHTKKEIEKSLTDAGFIINKISKMGQAKSSNKGLYIVIEGYKAL